MKKNLALRWSLCNCEIYLSAVYFDLATEDLIFIRVNIYPGRGGEGGGAHNKNS
jgi:hypothetical protein